MVSTATVVGDAEPLATLGAVAGLAGIVLAIVVPFGIERLKRPELAIRLGKKVLDGPRGFCFVHGELLNLPRKGVLGGLIERSAATSCTVQIRFLDPATRKELLSLSGKWSRAPEPLLPVVVGSQVQHVFDTSKIPLTERIHIPPGEDGDPFAVALKRTGPREAFGFNGSSYMHPDWLNPDYKLASSDVIVETVATSGSISARATFRLQTTGPNAADIELRQLS